MVSYAVIFLISGYLFKLSLQIDKTIFKRLLMPYISYYLLITIFIEKSFSIKNILKFIYGGRMYSGVYWFIPCLIITTVVFNFIVTKFSKLVSILIVISMGILATIESLLYIPNNTNYMELSIIYKLPLNIDVCFLSIVYFMIGFYMKSVINSIKDNRTNYWMFLIFLAFLMFFINEHIVGNFNYKFDMKYVKYNNFILNVTIPIIIGYIILVISKIFTENFVGKAISILGKNTLPIMFLHIPINSAIMNHINYRPFIYTILGIVIPLLFSYICSSNDILQLLFMGKQKIKRYQLKEISI